VAPLSLVVFGMISFFAQDSKHKRPGSTSKKIDFSLNPPFMLFCDYDLERVFRR
jgi:hypothetical protein